MVEKSTSVMAKLPLTNFAHLAQHDEQLLRLDMVTEKYFTENPNTCSLEIGTSD